MFVLTVCDIKRLIIPNVIVLPAIAVGIYFTGNWDYALLMFLIGALIFSKGAFCGGDVKLMAMVGAFMGNYSFLILLFAFALNIYYHRNTFLFKPRPFTPFVLIPSLFFIWV